MGYFSKDHLCCCQAQGDGGIEPPDLKPLFPSLTLDGVTWASNQPRNGAGAGQHLRECGFFSPLALGWLQAQPRQRDQQGCSSREGFDCSGVPRHPPPAPFPSWGPGQGWKRRRNFPPASGHGESGGMGDRDPAPEIPHAGSPEDPPQPLSPGTCARCHRRRRRSGWCSTRGTRAAPPVCKSPAGSAPRPRTASARRGGAGHGHPAPPGAEPEPPSRRRGR